MKKTHPSLALLRAYIKTRPTGINARAAMLAYALFRGMPFLVVEPSPQTVRGDKIVDGQRKAYPLHSLLEHRILLATCISVTALEVGRLAVTPEAALAWLNAPPTGRMQDRQFWLLGKAAMRNKARHDHSLRVQFNHSRYGWHSHDGGGGAALRAIRERLGLSLEEAATRLRQEEIGLGKTGRPVAMLTAWLEDVENGGSNGAGIERSVLCALAAAYGLDDAEYKRISAMIDGGIVVTREQVMGWMKSKYTAGSAVGGHHVEGDKRYADYGKPIRIEGPTGWVFLQEIKVPIPDDQFIYPQESASKKDGGA